MPEAPRRLSCAALMMSGWLLGASGALAQAVAVGSEFQINSSTTNYQRSPAVATNLDGDFVVVWDSSRSNGTDTSGASIQGQRYDAAGNSLGGEFQVNSYTTDSQFAPAVASAPDGGFVVVWRSRGSSGTDTSSFSIQGQRYAAAGDTVGGQFQVNSYTIGFQVGSAVAIVPDGGFVVVWQSDGSSGTDTSLSSIQGQRYDAAGNPIGGEFQVNSYTTYAQYYPKVASSPDGGFVVVWESQGSSGSDSWYSSIQGQRYDAAGNPIGAEIQVNSYTTNSQRRADVATDPDGDFVVVWESRGSSDTDTWGYSIQGQRYDAAGNSVGAQFQVNTYTTSDQIFPVVATDPDGDFVVGWASYGSSGTDTSFFGVQGQRYAAAGSTLGAQFQINSYTTGFQLPSALATAPDGDFVVVWASQGSSGSDTSYTSVQGQRYRVTSDLGDRVWRDLDLDGLQDPGEPGIVGISVHLFDSFATLLRSTVTDSEGLYRFRAKPGEYYLQFEPPRELSFTILNRLDDDAVDSDADVLTGETDSFAVSLLANDSTWDAGMANGLGDRVWLDQDGDGFQDTGEPGVAGIAVSLYDELGGLLASTVTDLEGFYSFQDLGPDRYSIGVGIPAGGAATMRDAVDDRFDSDIDPDSGRTPPVDLARGALDTSWDAGLILGPDQLPLIFADGFESGDTSAWGTAPP